MPGLDRIEARADGGVRLGALARNSDVAHHPAVRERSPALAEAILLGASAQLRNVATVGGNLLQRTRCWYFVQPDYACNKREPGSGCAAVPGVNRMRAVLGGSGRCVATHPSDMAVPLVALDAVVVARGPGGERRIPMGEFHLVPGETPHVETALARGELITAVELPPLPFAARSRHVKARSRASYAFALAVAAAALDVEGGRIRAARLALGGVAAKPWRAAEAERALVGQPPGEAAYRAAADAALAGARPLVHNGFKVELAKGAIVRALTLVGGTA